MNKIYNYKGQNVQLETYEWDNNWLEQTGDTDAKRVLYIGDSISCAVRRLSTAVAENSILFDGVATSKAVDNPYLFDTISLFADQQRGRSAVLFNSGLHGPHLDDATEYKHYYENILKLLLDKFKDTPLLLILSTAQAKPERDERVIARNQAVKELAEKYNLPVIDFYSISKANTSLLSEDGIHLTSEGYQLLANELVDKIKNFL